MTQKMRDEDFEGLLGRSLRLEAAPDGLRQRLLNQRQAKASSSWFVALVSPGRIAASAAILSLMMGFALGWGNTTSAEDQDLDVTTVLFAANDVGDF